MHQRKYSKCDPLWSVVSLTYIKHNHVNVMGSVSHCPCMYKRHKSVTWSHNSACTFATGLLFHSLYARLSACHHLFLRRAYLIRCVRQTNQFLIYISHNILEMYAIYRFVCQEVLLKQTNLKTAVHYFNIYDDCQMHKYQIITLNFLHNLLPFIPNTLLISSMSVALRLRKPKPFCVGRVQPFHSF